MMNAAEPVSDAAGQPAPSARERPNEFGRLLRAFRQRQGLTQEQLALAVFGNRRKATIGELENDPNRVPYPHTLRRLADALELSKDERLLLISAQETRRKNTIPTQPTHLTADDHDPAVAQILQHDAGTPMPPATPEIAAPLDGSMLNFPKFQSNFIGRENDTSDLEALIRQPNGPRIISVVGPGGTGKTRFTVHVAERVGRLFPDGAIYIGLDPLESFEDVVPEILRVMTIPEDTGRTPTENLIRSISSKNLLLVLDNFEQVVDAAREIAAVAVRSKDITILVTSRVPLNVSGEQQFRIGPLSAPAPDCNDFVTIQASDAVQLFVQQAGSRSRFQLTSDNCGAIAALCSRLDGLPLALELAAGRTVLLSPEHILHRLEKSLDLLTRGPQDLPERQQTLRATLDWSFRLLKPQEAKLLVELSVFADSWTVESAEQVCSGTAVLDTLSDLLDKNMIARTSGLRLRMLRTVREYALEQLEGIGSSTELRLRYIDWCVQEAETAAQVFRRNGIEDSTIKASTTSLVQNNAHFNAALHYALELEEHERLAALTGALTDLWVVEGRHYQVKRWVTAALAGDVSVRHRAYLKRAAVAVALYADADPVAAASLARTAEAEFRELALQREAIGMRFTAGNALRWAGCLEEAAIELENSVNESDERNEESIGNRMGKRLSLALVYDDLGETSKAESIMRDYLEYCELEGSVIGCVDVSAALALLTCADHRREEASQLAQRCIDLLDHPDMGYEEVRIDVLLAVGVCEFLLGRPLMSKQLLQEAVRLIDHTGYRLVLPDAISLIGATAAALDKPLRASKLLAFGESLRERKRQAIVGRLARKIVANALELTFANQADFVRHKRQAEALGIAEATKLATGW